MLWELQKDFGTTDIIIYDEDKKIATKITIKNEVELLIE